jgi:hypothetical protein
MSVHKERASPGSRLIFQSRDLYAQGTGALIAAERAKICRNDPTSIVKAPKTEVEVAHSDRSLMFEV